MRLGFNLPQSGPAATPEAVARVAERAEELGYESLWVWERLIRPLEPQTPYGGTPDGSYPEAFDYHIDPLATLLYAAAHTSKVTIGTSIINMPYYNPVMLARTLTTIDVLSKGRLILGLGLGWSKDEFDATNASMRDRGSRADEFVELLKAIWTTDPVEHDGKYYTLPRSSIQPKPLQKPHPPIYLAAYSEGGLRRIATMADGWTPVGIPMEGMQPMMDGLKAMAKEAGRDVKVAVRANVNITDDDQGEGRFIFYGSLQEIQQDVEANRELGVDEIFFDVSFSADGRTENGYLKRMEQLIELAR